MVRKGNQHKNSFDRKAANHKETVPVTRDVLLPEQKEKSIAQRQNTAAREHYGSGNLCTGDRVNGTNYTTSGKKNKQKHHSVRYDEKSNIPEAREPLSNVQAASEDDILFDVTERMGSDGIQPGNNQSPSLNMLRGLSMENMASHVWLSVVLAGQRLELVAMSMFNACSGWVEQQRPRLSTFIAYVCEGRDYILVQIKHVYPFIWRWIFHIGQLIFLLLVVWLDCNIRGFSSLLRLGTASFFTVVWCSILSIVSMVGFTKAFIVMVISALVGVCIGLAVGALILAIFATITWWLYGSLWITSLIIFIGGGAFALRRERIALLLAAIYSAYCAKSYAGWLGLLLGLNLSFLSSDILTYFVKNNINEQGSYYSSEQDGETSHSSPSDDASASRRSDVPSTSGADEELTSEGEVLRLLNCNDHYSALGFARFENIDVSLLKREYRKKAMLVHPDKNMGNEKAAEAFKKLQNAYEILLDTLKRKTYDDELKREELLNYFRRFQSSSQKNRKNNIFRSGSPHSEADGEGSHEESSRRIACKKCGDFHMWTRTERSKSQARWCQDCNDFHQAKDGDGWLEQSLHAFLFGLLHKVDAPRAYVCADGRIYDATEWFICQGMRCPANSHKPSFHVNTTLSSKCSPNAKGASSSSQRANGAMPNANNAEEMMAEEEFFEWLQNAMQSGAFEHNGGPSNESPSARSGGSSKASSGVKKKRKGKKQW